MMRASTRVGISAADVQIDVPLEEYGSLDWRRSADLIKEGYQAAEAIAISCCRSPSARPSTRSGSQTDRAGGDGSCRCQPS